MEVPPLEFKPADSIGDLLVQHLADLECEAKDKGGLDQALADHSSRIYKVASPRDLTYLTSQGIAYPLHRPSPPDPFTDHRRTFAPDVSLA